MQKPSASPYIVSLFIAGVAFSMQSYASLINFEYTVDDTNGDGSSYEYNFQFWVDVMDPDYSPTLGFNSINVNISEPSGPRPFGDNFITRTSPGFSAQDFTGGVNFSGILPEGPGFNFWQPTADDFFVSFTGVSSVLADMTWNYFGREDISVNTSGISGAGTFEFLTAQPVAFLTDFSPPPPDGPRAAVSVPPSLPLLFAGMCAFVAARRRSREA